MVDTSKVNGYKTYIIAVASICWALGGLVAGKVDANTAIQTIGLALTAMGLRHGIEKALNKD